jgi:hypothetical protein
MRHAPLLCALLAVGTLPAADFVMLDNDQRIVGTIDPAAEAGSDQVAINTGNGIIRIHKARVKGEDLGFEARRAKLKSGDLKGLIELAHWCRGKGMNQEAMDLLQQAMAMPGVELREKALYARLVDELKGPEEALPLYLAYRQDGGKDPKTIARLAELEKAKGEFDTANGDAGTAVATTTAAPAKPLVNISDGLESKGWAAEALQYSNPVDTKVITMTTGDGLSHALEISFKNGKMDKAAVRRGVHLTITDDSVLTFWAQNPGDKPINLSVAVKTGDKWDFFESPQMPVKPGEFQQLKFDLKASNFKSVATSWANTGKITALDDVKELQLLIYNGHSDGSLIVCNMGFPAKQDM